jgi:1-deoxy-D-xylulose-5-phosphate reductoisomerase
MEAITIFGSTGSIGVSTLEVLRLHPDKFSIFALTANSNYKLLAQQILEFKPQYAFLADKRYLTNLKHLIDSQSTTKILTEENDLIYLASHQQSKIVMSAIVGSAGLLPTYYAAKAGKKILLANKESLVAGGKLITTTARNNHAQLIPVDSEHSAIFQALPYGYTSLDQAGVTRLILTASGGPFLNKSYNELMQVTATQAIKHPNWQMGQKISVDSSTLMNKGLEVIEAYWLFNARPEQIEVLIHPQSIIHSMVEYCDSSIIAQLGTPDMKTPIAYALSAPMRINSGSKKLDFLQLQSLTFSQPDYSRFPCLKLALQALNNDNNMAMVINASNEIAVAKFLANQHGFYDIPRMIEKSLNKFIAPVAETIEELIDLDKQIKHYCQQI